MNSKKHDDAHGPEWTSDVRPAPGDLRIVQAFLNTVARRKHDDELASPQALADWLTRWRLLPKGPGSPPARTSGRERCAPPCAPSSRPIREARS